MGLIYHYYYLQIVQGEGNAAFMKFKYNYDTDLLVFKLIIIQISLILVLNVFKFISVDNQFKETNPHPENSNVFETDKDGNSVKRDLKFHHNSLW